MFSAETSSMEPVNRLSEMRRQYMEMTKLFLLEIKKGKTLHELSTMKQQIETLKREIESEERLFKND